MKVEEKVRAFWQKIKKENEKINAFLEVRSERDLVDEAKRLDAKQNKGRLYGYVIGVKSNINVKGLHASCASETLKDYVSTYDATVIEKIKAEDGLIIGICNCDEFACGWTGETSAFGRVDNPIIPGHVPGGSSSGSAAAVAAGFCDAALGSDTGGSIRVPASFCGVVGVKPSYGFVSRYGLIDLSMSLDQIGPIAKNISDAFLLLDVIRGKDDRDTKSFDSKEIYLKKIERAKIGIVNIKDIDKNVKEPIDKVVDKLVKEKKWKKENVEIKHIDLAVETYHPLVWTEFYSATRRFDGRKYGKKIEDAAGKEVLRRIFGGSEIAKAEHAGRYYHKALAVKELIKQEFEKAFKEFDCLISPTVPVLPWKFGSKVSLEQLYAVDALTIPGNLAEICAVSLPIGFIKDSGILKSVGLQVMCGKGEEGKMLSIAREIEKLAR